MKLSWLFCWLVGVFVFALGQAGVTRAEDQSAPGRFYQNYGSEPYAREDVRRDADSYYDLFGEHITDGFHIYSLNSDRSSYSLTNRQGFDSLGLAVNQEWATTHYWDNFTNLVATRDEVGGLKSTILVGDQIKTRFTPFTLNMNNYRGIRWDIWSQRLKLTALASRTRPGASARVGIQKIIANVTSPLVDGSFHDYVSGQWYPESDWMLNNSKWSSISNRKSKWEEEYSNKSPYGDYDFFWGLHAETDFGNRLQAGLTYMNHHHSDVAKGEEFGGNIPDAWVPEEIHFEFYDLTYGRVDDAGCFVDDNFKMTIISAQGKSHDAGGCAGAYSVSTVDSTLYTVLLPRTVHGREPLIVTFRPLTPVIPHGLSAQEIRHVTFDYSVAGNYLVFVTTDKFIPMGIAATIDTVGTRTVTYSPPFTRTVQEMFTGGWPIDGMKENQEGTTFFGDYIAKTPNPTFISRKDFDGRVSAYKLSRAASDQPQNYRNYKYEFAIKVNSTTYGVNFKTQLYGVNIAGEAAINIKDSKFPGKNNEIDSYTSNQARNMVLQLKANREFGEKLRLDGEAYRVDPQFETNLTELQPSLYLSKGHYAFPTGGVNGPFSWDYLVYPKPLSNEWLAVDDNEDEDILVENNRRRYPSNTAEGLAYDFFYQDGVMRTSYLNDKDQYRAKTVALPTGMEKIYDDPNGVIPDRYDRNKNGQADYREDFLLYSSDPPVFELGNDMNFNGVIDYEEDDFLPDYPYQIPYTITSNTYMSNGLQGIRGKLRFRLSDALEFNMGSVIESARNMNLTGNDFDERDKPTKGDGTSRIVYGSGMWKVAERGRRMDYFLGNEFFLVQDGIRNDAIQTIGPGVYRFVPDPMRFRNAIVNNFIGGLNFQNVPNLEVGTRVMLGIEIMKSLPGQQFYMTKQRTYLTAGLKDSIGFESVWDSYKDRAYAKSNLIQKFGYRKTWDYSFEGWRSALNVLNRIEVLPQYKVSYEFRQSLKTAPGDEDPRTTQLYSFVSQLHDTAQMRMRNEWLDYAQNTQQFLMSVPILRCNFQIASKTRIESGIQWQRAYDQLTPTNSYSRTTKIAQLVSRDNYGSYNVAIILGLHTADIYADANIRSDLFDTGIELNQHTSEIFVRVYAGL